MTRHLVILLGVAVGVPALGQGSPQGSPAVPGEERLTPPAEVDVNVDLASPGTQVSFATFELGLAPYGAWVTVPGYGTAWRPRVAEGWRPYYYGRWEWTDEGWLWVSDEPWGWATYHYGRWSYEPASGWIWVPGYQWAPAWVTWRYSPDYIGWAPLAPGFSVFVTAYPVHYGWWSFVPCTRFVGYPVQTVAYGNVYVPGLYRVTQPAPPRSVAFGAAAPAWGGPARPVLERRLGRPIAPVRLEPVASPGAATGGARPGVVPIYRPEARPVAGLGAGAAQGPRPWGAPPALGPPAPPRGAAPAQGWRGGAPPYPAPPGAAPRPPVPGGPRGVPAPRLRVLPLGRAGASRSR